MPNWGESSSSLSSFSDPSDNTDETWIKPETKVKKGPTTCDCGKALVLRHRKSDGHPFYGCSNYPNCKNTYSARLNWHGNSKFWPDFPDDQEDGWGPLMRDWGSLASVSN